MGLPPISQIRSLQLIASDLTDQCTSAVVNYVYEQLETTAFGDTARKFGALQLHRCKTTALKLSYTIICGKRNRGDDVWFGWRNNNVIVAPASGAASATNPIYTLTGCYLESHTPINASLGELSTITLTFAGGVLLKPRHDRAALAAEN
jgi:hypothetical protein